MSDNSISSPAEPQPVSSKPPPPKRQRAARDMGPSPAVGFPNGPVLRPVSVADVKGALAQGWADFRAAPQFGLFFGGFYALGGIFLYVCLAVWDTPWAIIPPAIAFPLLGPFIAVGLYEVSRRLSSGAPLAWGPVLNVVSQQKDRQLGWMAFVMLFVFWIWAYQVRLLLAIFLSTASFSSLGGLIEVVFTTENGLAFLGTGVVIGAILALVLFSVTVIGIPLLLDRDLDIVTAVASSVAVVRRNPAPMLAWGIVVTVVMILAMAPAFLGLLVALPVLGHATWRLYERAVAPIEAPAAAA
ncbi:MAG: DUF2189 domain-containing protein [Pseudomonadota bacterium]